MNFCIRFTYVMKVIGKKKIVVFRKEREGTQAQAWTRSRRRMPEKQETLDPKYVVKKTRCIQAPILLHTWWSAQLKNPSNKWLDLVW